MKIFEKIKNLVCEFSLLFLFYVIYRGLLTLFIIVIFPSVNINNAIIEYVSIFEFMCIGFSLYLAPWVFAMLSYKLMNLE